MVTVIIQVIVNSTIQVAVPMTQLVKNWIDDTSVEENNFGKRWTMRLKEKDESTRRSLVATVSTRATIRRKRTGLSVGRGGLKRGGSAATKIRV